jgi:hypothetical protein
MLGTIFAFVFEQPQASFGVGYWRDHIAERFVFPMDG